MLYDYDYAHAPYDDYSSFTPSPSSVDCTLSLGTPSTRLTQEDRRSSVSNFCWDLLQSKHTSHNPSKSTRPSNASSHNDPLLARRCANCDTTSTPLWRNGPRGPKSLCNACGIRFKKEERRASAAAASATSAAVPGGVMESAHAYGQHSNTWYAQSQSQKMGNEYRFMEDSDRESENGIPFLSWKLNVADRTSLVHDFTR
uniref:GATA transcription factor 19 n=2 Tax=Cajanus cajan TaxID=3821 RepID=A0A151SEU5_CAJCA|nr:GATA transcription factor 19 [Cajanus cajan]